MKFKLYKQFGALNSEPIFSAVEHGLKSLGLTVSDDCDSIPIIWSVLWQGRMESNKLIYETAQKNKIPVVIIEVGNLNRNQTWRISVNNVNRLGFFANDGKLDLTRPGKLGIALKDFQPVRRPEILITGQHEQSLQWAGLQSVNDWVFEKYQEIRKYTDRPIIFRPHPRWPNNLVHKDIVICKPKKLAGTYDDYDCDYNYHCVINHNSGPTVQAAIHGTPIVCDSSGLAYPVSNCLDTIEHVQMPDRTDWFLKLCHTEWTTDEIKSGIPIQRLLPRLQQLTA